MRICPKKIMCAVDFSGFAPMILDYGKALAREFNADLCVCHIVQDTVMLSSHAQAGFSTEEVTAQRIEDAMDAVGIIAEQADVQADTLVSLGHPADEITRLAQKNEVDLVIAATHGGSGIKRFLVGSVTDRLVKTLECPLLVLHPGTDKQTPQVRLPMKRILVGCDFSEGSDLAFNYALSLAQEFEAELHLVHVVKPQTHVALGSADAIRFREDDFLAPDPDPVADQPISEKEREGRSRDILEQMEGQLSIMVPEESRNWCTPVIRICRGEPYMEILEYAKNNQIDMIVLGIHGHSLLEQFLVGSTTDRVISRADCPVLAVRQVG